MFDLDHAIAEWRRQLLAAGIKPLATLNELESHLREDVAGQLRAGTEAQAAFDAAVQRIGDARPLKAEFAKAARWTWLCKFKSRFAKLFNLGHPCEIPALADFSTNAQETLAFAREEAPRFQHDFIGTEHVLLGLTRTQDGIVPRVMRRMGVDSEHVRREIERWVGLGQAAPRVAAEIPFTPRAKRALSLAAREARAANHPVVGAEDIFLGLLLEGSGVAALVLNAMEVDVEKARAELLKETATGGT